MNLLKNRDWATLSLFFLLATSPLLFGARYPLIQGFFTTFILFTGGIWTVSHIDEVKPTILRPIIILPVVLLVGIFLTSLSLPVSFLEIISPIRAEHLNKATAIAQLSAPVTSLSYFAFGTRLVCIFLLALFLYFFYCSQLFHKKEILITALWVIVCIGIFEAVYGILQTMIPTLRESWFQNNLPTEGYARGTIINNDQYAAFMNLCWPLAIALGMVLYKPVADKIRFRTKMKNKLTLAEKINAVFQKATIPFWGSLIMIIAVISSGSSGGIIIMFLTASLLCYFLPAPRRIKTSVTGIFLLLIGLYGAIIGFQTVIYRFGLFYEGTKERFGLWLDSLSMLKDHLFVGIGMGAYKYLSPIYLEEVPQKIWFDFAHNEYVELAIELGLPMLILFLAWVSWGMGRSFYKIRLAKKISKAVTIIEVKDRNIISICCYCAITGFLLHGFVDFIWRLPVNAIYSVTLLAMINAAATELKTTYAK